MQRPLLEGLSINSKRNSKKVIKLIRKSGSPK